MKKIFILVLSILLLKSYAQKQEYVYRNSLDSSFNCYLKVYPKGEIKGLLLRDYSSLPPKGKKSPYQWQKLVLEKGFLILITNTTDYFPDLYLDDSGQTLLDEIINEVILEDSVPKNNIFIGGISASGTRALRYTQFCEEGKSKYGIKIKGAFVVDSPLDNERFYKSAKEHGHLFKGGMEEEAVWMMNTYPEKLGGSPTEFPERYLRSSVFSYTDSLGGNARHFANVSLLIFHEPDIDWWLNKRGASYFDINSFDLVAFTNMLRHFENSDVQLITSTGKGFKGKVRNCHSWTMVDESYLANWLAQRLD